MSPCFYPALVLFICLIQLFLIVSLSVIMFLFSVQNQCWDVIVFSVLVPDFPTTLAGCFITVCSDRSSNLFFINNKTGYVIKRNEFIRSVAISVSRQGPSCSTAVWVGQRQKGGILREGGREG